MGTVSQLTRARAVQWARQSIDRLDARLLLQFVCGCTANALIADPDVVLDEAQSIAFQSLVHRRQAGEPLAYLIGQAGFYGDLLTVTADVLVPRPETEDLVDWALEVLRDRVAPKIADLGTGSGAIALALAGARPDAQIVAVDVSTAALSVAAGNRQQLGRNNVEFVCANWYEGWASAESLDVIVSNPPYIAHQDPHLTQGDLRFEPVSALTDYASGLSCLESIIAGADQYLKPGGLIAVEHGFDQSEAVVGLMKESGLIDIQVHLDLAGHCRAASGRKRL